ncbi:phosphodiester glycosidase family protein [Candidatus Bipolaricaulota bacterium]|nr:phosphodiester glycosidase family protein [Candidatus Bipolaricaulota bacterium]
MKKKLGEVHPVISFFPSLPGEDVEDLTEEITDSGEVLLSAHSRINYALRKALENEQLFIEDGKLRSEEVNSARLIEILYEKNNLYVESDRSRKEKLREKSQLLPVNSNCGFPSRVKHKHEILMNASFFLLEPSDMKSVHSLFCQPYGLILNRGKVLHPPLFPRGAIIRGEDESKAEVLSIRDVDLKIGEERLKISDNCSVFTRAKTYLTPENPHETHLAVVNNQIVSYKENGGLRVPDAGFVLAVKKDLFSKLELSSRVEYFWRNDPGPSQPVWGIQVGPVLFRDGSVRDSFGEEAFSDRHPPTVFPYNWNETPAARLAIAVTEDEEMMLLAVEGCNDSDYHPGFDSRGATLEELVELLRGNNVKCALNLDGGGSTSLYFEGGSCIKKADRKKLPGVAYERPVPLVITGRQE